MPDANKLSTSAFSISPIEFTVLTATLMSIVAISIDALLPALGFITEGFQIDDENRAQLLISTIFLGMSLGQLICGPLSDALGRKPVLFGGLFLYLIGTFICYIATDFHMLLLGRLLEGLGVAGPYISAISLVRDRYAGRDMAKIMSFVMMIFMLVPAIAPSIGQAILYISDWRGIFVLYAIYALIIVVWISIRLPETLPKSERIPFTREGFFAGFKEVLTNKVTASLTLSMGLIFGCVMGYINSSQQIFQVQFNTGEMFSLYFGVLALILGVSSLVNSRFVQKVGMHNLSIRAFQGIILSSVIFILVQFSITEVKLWMFMIYASTLFFAFGLLFGNLNAMAMEPMGHVAGIASAVIGSVSAMMSIVIGTTIGQLYNNTLFPVTGGFLVIGCLALALLYYAEKEREKVKAMQEA